MLTTEFDINEAREVWREEALEEGIQLGEQRGIQLVRRRMILGLRQIGVSDEMISKASGLSLAEIQNFSAN